MEQFDQEYLLDLYLNGQLSGETQVAFDKALESDSAFADKVKAGELAIVGLKSHYIERRIAEIKKKVDGGAKIKTISWYRRPLAIAASIGLLIVAGIVAYLNINQTSLYQQYAEHPRLAITQMSSDGSYDLSKAETAFNTGDYTTARTELTSYLTTNPNDTLALFYQGIGFLELNEFPEALRIFTTIGNGQSDFQALGQWYLALTYLKQEDEVRTQQILQEITVDSEKYNDAQALLKKLN